MCIGGNSTKGFHNQFARDINGVHTEFVFHRFENKWFLLITQYGKAANLYTIEFDVNRDGDFPLEIQGPVNHPQFHVSIPITVRCKFGVDKDEIHSAIQFLINRSKLNQCRNEIVISLGLKEINGKNLSAVAEVLNEIIDFDI